MKMRCGYILIIAFFSSGQLCSSSGGLPPSPPTTPDLVLHVKRWLHDEKLLSEIKRVNPSFSGFTELVSNLKIFHRYNKLNLYIYFDENTINDVEANETYDLAATKSGWLVNVRGGVPEHSDASVDSRVLHQPRQSEQETETDYIRTKILHECRMFTREREETRLRLDGDETLGGKYECQLIKEMNVNGCSFHVMGCFLSSRGGNTSKYLARERQRRNTESRPELVYTFIEQAVQAGAQVTLKCSAVGEPPPRFRWTLDGQPIPAHHGASISEGREGGAGGAGGAGGYVLSALALGGARVEHGGRYECRATNAHGTVSHAARLNVYGPPYIRSMNAIKAVAGTEIVVWCPYYGFPIDSVKWEGGSGSDPRYQQAEGQLRIAQVDKARDQGAWTCSVQTPAGELARREVQMLVVSPPVLAPMSFPAALKVGERTQVSCTVTSGDMPVYFSWLKDQMPIATALQVEERNAEFLSMLLFKSLSAAHSGVYTCVVTNTAGKANTSVELAIKVPPYWHVEPSDTSVLLNASVTISCDARGHPPPTIYWTKFAGSTETSVGGGGTLEPAVLGNGSLRIERARVDHAGTYRCRADNNVAPPLARTFTLHVNEPAHFAVSSVNVSHRAGEAARLACAARGASPLSAAWSLAGRPLPGPNYRMSISETRSAEGLRSELVIERADRRDSGAYRCQAVNPYGRSDLFIHLSILEPPEPPENLRVVETSSRSVRVSWRRPYDGNSPVLGYELQYRRHDAAAPPDPWRAAAALNLTLAELHADRTDVDADYTDEQALVSGLSPATAYVLRARTLTAVFASAPSRGVLALTQHEPPARAPAQPRPATPPASATAYGQLHVQWQAPPRSSWNGELLGYTVWWWAAADGGPAGGSPDAMEYATVRGHVTKYIIEGLDHYTRYSVSVRAFNSAGAGPASTPINLMTPEYVPALGPSGVRCRGVSPHSLRVEWSPPPPHAHRGALLGYKLLYRPDTAEDWVEWGLWGAETGPGGGAGAGAEVKRVAGVETVVLALRPHTNYTLQALAYTAAGDGAPAPPVRCRTQPDVPSAPAAVKVVPTSATSLSVSWLPPLRPNGPILYYTVFYRELGRDRPAVTSTVGAGAGEAERLVGLGGVAELRPLAEGVTYEAWLTAHSAAGEGEPSAPQHATTTNTAGGRVVSFGVWARVACGAGVHLACAARGVPAPRARWLRHARAVTHDPRAQLDARGHLAVHEVDSMTSGNYTCSARNAFGSEEATTRVQCVGAPPPPALALLAASHDEARLAWTQPNPPHHALMHAQPHGYTIWWVRVREEGGGGGGEAEAGARGEEERRLEVGGEAGGATLRDLSCGATYAVRVVAHSHAGPSPPSDPLLVRTKPPVLVWEGGGGGGGGSVEGLGAEGAVWSNSSCVCVDVRRAVRCGARLLRLQWRRADSPPAPGAPPPWRDADLPPPPPPPPTPAAPHPREVIIDNLAAGAWYALRLWTATESTRHQAIIYAATTTDSGERLRRPASFTWEGAAGNGAGATSGGGDTERVLGAVSLAFAALAATAVTALLFVLLSRRSTLWPCGRPAEEDTRRCSHSAASTDKSVCPEQQNMRNCQHDYKHDKLSPASDVYEISPYATFAVGGGEATLDHSLQFRTFGHRDNDAPPHRACRKHPQRHRDRTSDKHMSDCELSQLSRYEKVRPRHCAATSSYCVPMQHHGVGVGSSGGGGGSGGGVSEVYAGDSSAESGPGSLSPKTHLELS